MKKPLGRVVCLMSGGVDSSVAASMLVHEGYEVIGVTMRVWQSEDDRARACCSIDAVADARRAAYALGIPHYALNLEEEFESLIVKDFVDEYARGFTPNPCIRCNHLIKFGILMRRARELGADYIATGHYARVTYHPSTGRRSITRAIDKSKDQSYVLYGLTQDQLAMALFPLGGQTKSDTRRQALELGLEVADKPDSQEICFISGDYRDFVVARRPELARWGQVLDLDGRVVGTHKGTAFYTIGQRHGLGIPSREPLYVIALNAQTNTVVVGPAEKARCKRIKASHVVMGKYREDALAQPQAFRAMVRYRMRPEPAECVVYQGELQVEFEEPVRGVAPGQAAVCYEGDDIVCGGTIFQTESSI